MILFPHTDWSFELSQVLHDTETTQLFKQVDETYQKDLILPSKENIFKAFELTSFNATQVVILGQDPYPDPENAMGLSFSVMPGGKIPRSLKNIYKERKTDIGIDIPETGDLSPWAKQGVLLLNSVLTVKAHKSNSHLKLNWQHFTNAVISHLNQRDDSVIFVLWGNYPQSYAPLITNPQHHIIMSSHPSPFSIHRTNIPFSGSKPFSKINDYLQSDGKQPIDWNN